MGLPPPIPHQQDTEKAARNEGLATGAIVGALAATLPKIVFRRFRGRIIPMRAK